MSTEQQKALMAKVGGEYEFFSAGGVTVKAYGMPAKTQIEQHTHSYDHLSWLSAGTAHLIVDGVHTIVQGPAMVTIEKDKKHTIIAETDLLWLCIHSEHEAMKGHE